jgi:hypothetical protein
MSAPSECCIGRGGWAEVAVSRRRRGGSTSSMRAGTGESAGCLRLRPPSLRRSQARSQPNTATNLKAMAEPSPTRGRIADVDVGAPGWPWEALQDLEAQELRLYALGWGDHLPVELRERIETIRWRKLALEEHMLTAGDGRATIDEDLCAG